MKTLQKILLFISVAMFSSCYSDHIDNFDFASVGFAIQRPLRTVIADRDMEIRVGVSIGGKREVSMNDWAKFEIDPSLLEGTKLELLPADYYTLSDPTTFRVAKPNLPVADVAIRFTQAFYDDPKSVGTNYALPFRIKEHSLDSVYEGKETSIVAIKYISTFHGTYYVKGNLYELDNAGQVVNTTTYDDKDLIKNMTRDIKTLSTNVLERPGLANFPASTTEKIKLTIMPDDTDTYKVLIETANGGIAISNGEGAYYVKKDRPEIVVKYAFTKGGKNYRAEETLILRQDPLNDLRVETW